MDETYVYETKHPYPKRRFELSEDSIRGTGSRNFMDFDITLPLDRLDPAFERLWAYRPSLMIGYCWTMIAAMLMLMVFIYVQTQDYRGSLLFPCLLAFTFSGMGISFTLIHRHKTEFVQFRLATGIPILAVPKDSKQSKEFTRFVEILTERIERARDEGSPSWL